MPPLAEALIHLIVAAVWIAGGLAVLTRLRNGSVVLTTQSQPTPEGREERS